MIREFYIRDTAKVAKELLGKMLVHNTAEGITKGIIVETEAYYGELDPASHAYGGKKTPRNEAMWGPPGYAYVYFTYGMHYMLNVVTGKDGEARAVLIRAVEPLEGIELMKKRRNKRVKSLELRVKGSKDGLRNLTNGPARLTQAFGIDKHQNKVDMINSNLRILGQEETPDLTRRFKIVSCPRIGIKQGTIEKLRFYIDGNSFVSKV